MSTRIKLVRNDNRPYIRLTLTSSIDGTPIDVSAVDTDVNVYFRAVGTTTVLTTLVCSKPNGGADGVVQFSFPNGALDVPAGSYEGEIEISFGGSLQTIYQPLKFVIREEFA
jgi:hypothetical protein